MDHLEPQQVPWQVRMLSNLLGRKKSTSHSRTLDKGKNFQLVWKPTVKWENYGKMKK
jgi:hypothetical protein